MNTPLRHTTVSLAAMATAVILSACGGSDDEPTPASPADSGSAATESGSGSPESGILVGLDTLGYAVEAAIGSVNGYEVDGSTLRIRIGEDFDEYLASVCTIIQSVASAVDLPPEAVIELEYDDAVKTCEI